MNDTTSRSYYKKLAKKMSAKNAELENQRNDAIHFALNAHEDMLIMRKQLAESVPFDKCKYFDVGLCSYTERGLECGKRETSPNNCPIVKEKTDA